MRRVPAKYWVFKQNHGIELAQIFYRNAIAITLVARILPQLTWYRHENYRCFQTEETDLNGSCATTFVFPLNHAAENEIITVAGYYNINF